LNTLWKPIPLKLPAWWFFRQKVRLQQLIWYMVVLVVEKR